MSQAALAAGPVIVEVTSADQVGRVAASVGVSPTHLFSRTITGFAADVSQQQQQRLERDWRVLSVTADVSAVQRQPKVSPMPEQPPQFVTSGVRRVGGLSSPTAKIDGLDERVDVDVAVLDTGIDPAHPDLNVAGGVNCAAGKGWHDRDGHGTLVAGFVGAIDNSYGAVGVAPGARVWGVRVANNGTTITTSALLCGLEWVTANSATIEIANMSLSMQATVTGPCGVPARGNRIDHIHRAVCAATAAGVTVVAAAGNDSEDANGVLPAAYPEVITVSALADSDGLPSGSGPPPGCEPEALDDHLAFFSNFGSVVDIAAPGVCISSTYPGGQYASSSGTSFAAPLVAGAAALLKARNPGWSPQAIRTHLLSTAEAGPIPGDPDAFPEGVLNVSSY